MPALSSSSGSSSSADASHGMFRDDGPWEAEVRQPPAASGNDDSNRINASPSSRRLPKEKPKPEISARPHARQQQQQQRKVPSYTTSTSLASAVDDSANDNPESTTRSALPTPPTTTTKKEEEQQLRQSINGTKKVASQAAAIDLRITAKANDTQQNEAQTTTTTTTRMVAHQPHQLQRSPSTDKVSKEEPAPPASTASHHREANTRRKGGSKKSTAKAQKLTQARVSSLGSFQPKQQQQHHPRIEDEDTIGSEKSINSISQHCKSESGGGHQPHPLEQQVRDTNSSVGDATTLSSTSRHPREVPQHWQHARGGSHVQMQIGAPVSSNLGASEANGLAKAPFEDKEAAARSSIHTSSSSSSNNKPILREANNSDYAPRGVATQFSSLQRRWRPYGASLINQQWLNFTNSKASLIPAFLLAVTGLLFLPRASTHRPIRVAFIGNSITFVNDLPRFMEAISSGYISQNSCLHGASRLRTMLNTGNGMHNKWQTETALIKNITEDDDLYAYVAERDDDDDEYGFVAGEPYPLYDYGACTVPQLLLGTDANLTMNNANGKYRDDGKNPCIEDPVYFQYQKERYLQMAREHSMLETQEAHPDSFLHLWDYVVLNDQTNVPAIDEEREMSEQVLKYVYAPYLQQINAKPVLLMTHAYSYNASVQFDADYDDIWQDVPTFTSALYSGYQRYAEALSQVLPSELAPVIAPAGLAFLTVWEENRNMWERLFFVDGFHPTPHGTFLIGCVLYATLYQKMPANIPTDQEDLWSRARKMQIGSDYDVMPFPTQDEAIYLATIAERVTLKRHTPKSLDTSNW